MIWTYTVVDNLDKILDRETNTIINKMIVK